MGDDFYPAFQEAAKNADNIHFDLTGLDIQQAWQRGGQGWTNYMDMVLNSNMTNLEFHEVVTHWLDKTTFYRNNERLTPIEVQEMLDSLEEITGND